MSERSIVITEESGTYKIHNSVFSEFELLGLLEQIVFNLKYSRQAENPQTENKTESKTGNETESNQSLKPIAESALNIAETIPETKETEPATPTKEKDDQPKESSLRISSATASAATDLRTRIGNATKAVRNLGGKVEQTDLSKMSDEELQTELEELTAQYKRLKNSKGNR